MNQADAKLMERALILAKKGRGAVSPNPMVGACVAKGSRIISEGYHKEFGGPHAEMEALKKAGSRARRATLYVTLEPCSTWGKTPPCVREILRSGISRVVVGTLDPNPQHKGKAIALLRKNRVRVAVGILREKCDALIGPFGKWIKRKLPYVTMKLALSLDGKIATRSGDSKWITGEPARKFAHELRARHDAVLVGKNTALRDDPRLTVRHSLNGRNPWRVVLDTHGDISPKHRIFQGKGVSFLVCGDRYVKRIARKFSRCSVSMVPVRVDSKGRINLTLALRKIAQAGVISLLVEGGGEVAWDFFKRKLVDEAYFIISPKIIGGRNAKTAVEGEGISSVSRAFSLRRVSVRPLGRDFVVHGYTA